MLAKFLALRDDEFKRGRESCAVSAGHFYFHALREELRRASGSHHIIDGGNHPLTLLNVLKIDSFIYGSTLIILDPSREVGFSHVC